MKKTLFILYILSLVLFVILDVVLTGLFVFFFVNMFIDKVDIWQPAIWFGILTVVAIIDLVLLIILTFIAKE